MLILILQRAITHPLIRPHSHSENVHILILVKEATERISIRRYGYLQTGIQIRQQPQLCLYQALLMVVQKHLLELHHRQRLPFNMHQPLGIKLEFTHPQQRLEYIRGQIQQESTTILEPEKEPLHQLHFTLSIRMFQVELA